MIWGAAAIACLPALVLHFSHLWEKPHYQFFPVVPLAAGLLARRAFKNLGPLEPGSRRVVGCLLGFVWVLLLTAAVVYSPWVAAIAAVILPAVAAYALGGVFLVRQLLPAWVILWLLVPLPLALDDKLTTAMQMQAARLTSGVLDYIGIYHFMSGAVIEVPTQKFMIEQACSGAQSLFAVLFCTLTFLFWNRYRFLRAAGVLLAAAFWVLLANVARLVAVAWLGPRWGVDLSSGWRHEVLGWVLFLVTLSLVWSTDKLFAFVVTARTVFRQMRSEASGITTTDHKDFSWAKRQPTVLPDLRGVRVPWLAPAAFGALALVQVACFWPRHFFEFTGTRIVQRMSQVSADALPSAIGPWHFVNFDTRLREKSDREGEHSLMWRYQNGRLSAIVAVDYPFKGWHDLVTCYRTYDWQLEPTADGEMVPDPADNYTLTARYKKPLGRSAVLRYALVDRTGRAVPPPPVPGKVKGWIFSRVESPLGTLLGNEESMESPQRQEQQTFQIQVFVESYFPLTAEEEQQTLDLYHAAYAELRKLAEGIK